MSKTEDLWMNKDFMERANKFSSILNQEPPKDWVKDLMPGVRYIPIERVEWELASVFGKFWYEVKKVDTIRDTVYVVVTVHYYNPVFDVWEAADGVGAAPILIENGPMAVAMALPAAKTFAVKDAVEPLGKIFGRDLNRADQITYDNLSGKKKEDTELTNKIVTGLKAYKGADKEALKSEYMSALKSGVVPDELKTKLANKLKIEL